jgi:hypothetical protein
MPPGDAVTRYPVIPEPGLAGGVQATDAEALAGLATTPVGAVAAGVRTKDLTPPLAATKICPSPEDGVLKVATPDTAAW